MDELWNECRKHFRRIGFRCKPQRSILDYIRYKFDEFTKGDEKFFLYVLSGDDLFSSVVEAAKVIISAKSESMIKIVIPSGIAIPAAIQRIAVDNNIGLLIIDERTFRVTEIAKGFTRAQIARIGRKDFQQLILNINRISKTKFGIALFLSNKRIMEAIRPTVKNKDEFIAQVAALGSVLELINKDGIRTNECPVTDEERNFFSSNQTINIMDFFLKRKGIAHMAGALRDLQKIKILRNMPPMHASTGSLTVARKILGRRPITDEDWAELGSIVFAKFQGALIQLRNQIRN